MYYVGWEEDYIRVFFFPLSSFQPLGPQERMHLMALPQLLDNAA